jgi:uncharacterized delta-60 repeat protein
LTVSSLSNTAGVVIQPADGKIVICGSANGSNFVLTRYKPNGTLDTTFGVGGTATISAPAAWGFALQPDGKFVVCGPGSRTVMELARITPSGTLDTTFGGGNGYVTTSFGTADQFISLTPVIYPSTGPDTADAGKIEVVADINGNPVPPGINSGQIAVARFNADGSPDSSFGQSGQVVTPFPNSGAMAWAAALQADGKIIFAGATCVPGNWNFSLLRYNRDGSLDTTFSNSYGNQIFPNGGLVVTPETNSRALAVAIQPDGRIVAAGYGNSEFMIACYLAGPEIGTFTASASTVTSGSSLTLTASNLSDGDPSGPGYATITQVAFYAVDQSGNRYLLGYGTYSNGAWTLNDTVSLASGSYTLLAEATDSDGIVGDSAFLPLTVQ